MVTDETLLGVCNFLSFTVMVKSVFSGIPQIYDVITSTTTEGLSLNSIVLELIAYSAVFSYFIAMGYMLNTYLEMSMAVLQDFVLVVVVLHKQDKLKWQVLPLFVLYITAFIVFAGGLLPRVIMVAAMYLTTPVLLWSKIDQLTTILRLENSGCVSIFQWLMKVYDTAVRILTTAVITQDMPTLVNLVACQVLNIAILFAAIYYKDNASRQLTD